MAGQPPKKSPFQQAPPRNPAPQPPFAARGQPTNNPGMVNRNNDSNTPVGSSTGHAHHNLRTATSNLGSSQPGGSTRNTTSAAVRSFGFRSVPQSELRRRANQVTPTLGAVAERRTTTTEVSEAFPFELVAHKEYEHQVNRLSTSHDFFEMCKELRPFMDPRNSSAVPHQVVSCTYNTVSLITVHECSFQIVSSLFSLAESVLLLQLCTSETRNANIKKRYQ